MLAFDITMFLVYPQYIFKWTFFIFNICFEKFKQFIDIIKVLNGHYPFIKVLPGHFYKTSCFAWLHTQTNFNLSHQGVVGPLLIFF